MKIYFAGSITGGRDDVETYSTFINHLKQFGDVRPEHVGDKNLSALGEVGVTSEEVHDRNLDDLLKSNVLVTEITNPSLGVGYEIGKFTSGLDRPVLALYREKEGTQVSRMILGSPNVEAKPYKSMANGIWLITDFMNRNVSRS